jgi:general stress protein 26
MSVQHSDKMLDIARTIMKEADYCFFMTHGESGEINARLMHPFEPDAEFNIYLGASPKSRKAREVLKQHHVTLSFINPRSTAYVTLVGTATLENDAALKRKYWRSYWTDMYPGGPENSEYILIKIAPQRLEFMNFANAALPQPFGLKPNGLQRSKSGTWIEIEARETL